MNYSEALNNFIMVMAAQRPNSVRPPQDGAPGGPQGGPPPGVPGGPPPGVPGGPQGGPPESGSFLESEDGPPPNPPELDKAIRDVCESVNIARIECFLYLAMIDKRMNHGIDEVVFDGGEYDDEGKLVDEEMTGTDNPITFKIYPKKGVTWSEADKKNVIAFIKLIHVSRSRNQAALLAEQYMFHDREMGIYNLPYYLRRLGKYVAQRRIGQFNTCRFNLQRFSSVNLQLGRKKGTELMRRYVQMLQTRLGEDEIVCRIGGDNFICLYKKEHQKAVEDHMKGVHMVYDEVTGEAIQISAYAGFYFIPENTDKATDVMDNVSAAAAQSKIDRSNPHIYYDEKLIGMLEHKKLIETLFPMALENEEFLVYYQPKIKLDDFKMIGAEALCRWRHEGRIVPPDEFIPVLEQTTAICRLDFYMLEHVCRDIRRWIDEGKDLVKVSVNLSRRHLGTSHLLEKIVQIIDMYAIPHEYIEIELTETTTDVDFTDLKQIVFGLQKVGISTSVDDFGIGFSSMNMIRDLPWNVLKIDKCFIPDFDNPNDKHFTMLKYLIAMSQEMGLECIVEGVETQDQVNLLKQDGCFLAQGFFFDRPLPVDVFEERLKRLNE